jgi:hypothetical protein
MSARGVYPYALGSPLYVGLDPVVWAIWSSGELVPSLFKLGFVYEFRCGEGKVIVTSMNFLDRA